jgi:hypothetical protein
VVILPERQPAKIYLLMRVSTGIRCNEGRAGVRLTKIADKNMHTARTTCLSLDIPVSFLNNPDICRTETNAILLIPESQD